MRVDLGHVVTSVVGLGALDDPFVSRGAINRKEENKSKKESQYNAAHQKEEEAIHLQFPGGRARYVFDGDPRI